MVILAKNLGQLRYSELMEVYAESIWKAAEDRPELPRGLAVQLAEQDLYQYLKDVFFRTEGAVCGVLERDGRYACALRLEPYRDGLLLSALETAPEFRRQGCAGELIGTVTRGLNPGTKVYSHVNKKNLASRKTHGKCGFRVISDRAVYLNGSVDYRCDTWMMEVKQENLP